MSIKNNYFSIVQELQMRVNVNSNGHVYGQVSSDEPEKSILYHEPINNHIVYPFQSPNIMQTPDYIGETKSFYFFHEYKYNREHKDVICHTTYSRNSLIYKCMHLRCLGKYATSGMRLEYSEW